MAFHFDTKTWKAREGVGLNMFSIDGGEPVEVVCTPSDITEPGDSLSADNLNALEKRISNAINTLPIEISNPSNRVLTITGGGLDSADASADTSAVYIEGGLVSTSGIRADKVYNAVWNDIADCIEVDCEPEPGYCYCFTGTHYIKSNQYMDKHFIGIHSDTYGFSMGSKGKEEELKVAIAGFVLAYVDKEYEVGTPLTCTANGYLTEFKEEDKLKYPERIVATYWKPEHSKEWGSNASKIKVNGRHWVKIK